MPVHPGPASNSNPEAPALPRLFHRVVALAIPLALAAMTSLGTLEVAARAVTS